MKNDGLSKSAKDAILLQKEYINYLIN